MPRGPKSTSSCSRHSCQEVGRIGFLAEELSFDVSPTLNPIETRYVDQVSKTYIKASFENGVPFNLVEREDFTFEGE